MERKNQKERNRNGKKEIERKKFYLFILFEYVAVLIDQL